MSDEHDHSGHEHDHGHDHDHGHEHEHGHVRAPVTVTPESGVAAGRFRIPRRLPKRCAAVLASSRLLMIGLLVVFSVPRLFHR